MRDPAYAAFFAHDPFFDIVRQGLAGLVDGDHYFDTIAPDAVFEFRYRFPGYQQSSWAVKPSWLCMRVTERVWRSHGADALVVNISQIPASSSSSMKFRATAVGSGKLYENRFISVVTIEDRKIVGWRDYMDSLAAMSSLTLDPLRAVTSMQLSSSRIERPGIAAGPFFFLSSERLDLEIHTTHAAHAAATRRHAATCVLLRHFGHHGFGGDQQRRNGGRVLDRHANHLGRVDDALGDQVAVFAGLRVEAVGVLILLEDLADDDRAVFTGVDRDLAGRRRTAPCARSRRRSSGRRSWCEAP